jgi:hypothetical protein
MWGVMGACGGVWLFRVKNGPKKNHNVSRDGTVADGEFTMNMMSVLMVSAAEEPSADGDESAMVA